MPQPPSRDFDGLSDREILDLAQEVRDSWSDRDRVIKAAKELRDQTWKPPVPKNWEQTAKPQHSALPREISARVIGTFSQHEPTFVRVDDDDDVARSVAADTVERYHLGAFQEYRQSAVPGKDGWHFALAQMVNTGALCVGSILAPHHWASGPLFLDGDSPRREHWRDSSGKLTDDEKKLDWEASSRAYEKAVDGHRRTAGLPIVRRILETNQAFPLFTDGGMQALFVYRKSSLMELGSNGFEVDTTNSDQKTGRTRELLEVWTPNACRYYVDDKPLRHPDYGDKLVHRYGRVPFSYRTGLEGGDLEYGAYGLPLLHLVEANIRMIDTLLTFQHNAIHLASFPSWFIKYLPRPDGGYTALVVDKDGKQISTFDFKSGTIMDFGPDKEVQPFLHPGMNKDFNDFLKFQIEEVHRIIPRTLQGQPTSSGYETAQLTVNAKAIFAAIMGGAKLSLIDTAKMDMRLLERLGGPVYLNVEQGQDSRKPKYSRVKIEPKDIGGYYQIGVLFDPVVDHITEGTFRRDMRMSGIGDDEWVAAGAGITDYQGMLKRQARDRVMKSEQIMAALEQEAIAQFGLKKQQQRAQLMGRIQFAPDGTPLVKTPHGLAGPGVLPQAQGPMGAMLGGANPGSSVGQPNFDSTANPALGLPGAPSPAPSRRGGRPGAPQHQNPRPTPQPSLVA